MRETENEMKRTLKEIKDHLETAEEAQYICKESSKGSHQEYKYLCKELGLTLWEMEVMFVNGSSLDSSDLLTDFVDKAAKFHILLIF